MIAVGLARVPATYEGLTPPYGPGASHPESLALLGEPGGRGKRQEAEAPNPVYAGFRAALQLAGLDATRFGSSDWNPLGDLVSPGGHVVLKPNFIRHQNPSPMGSVESVITHGTILRAALDYAWLAVGAGGRVSIAEAPQMDCDFDQIRSIVGLDALECFYRDALKRPIDIVDLRQEAVVFENGIIVERRPLPGDPAGYRVVDLGRQSFFEDSGLDPDRFRGADYDPGPTGDHHCNGKNEYLLSETVLSARIARQIESSTRGGDFIRAGNWHGNQTTWRMCMDLNRCLYYSDRHGLHLDAPAPVRQVLTVLDGVVAGENEGPLAPTDRPLGAIVVSTDPVAADLAAVRLMGFDERRIPKIRSAMADKGCRITRVRDVDQVRVFCGDPTGTIREHRLDEIESDQAFVPHRGWRGQIERIRE